MSARTAGWLVVVVVASGCAANTAPEDEGYVVLDQSARLSGAGVEVGGALQTGALPIRVAPADGDAQLVTRDFEEPLAVAAGEVVVVSGEDAELRRLALGRDTDPHGIDVDGSESAVLRLAEALGGDAERVGAAWRIFAPNALVESARVEAPEGLVQILPLSADWAAAPAIEDWAADSVPRADAPRGSSTTVPDVGSFALEGLFGGSVRCDGATGVWRGQQYLDHQGQWYRFTLNVERAAEGRVVGHIVSHGWRGDRLDHAPPGAEQNPSVHYKIHMRAAGAADDSKVSFRGLDWTLAERFSGWAPEHAGDYCEDKFEGSVGADGMLRADNDDGCNPVSPIVFTRVACSDR